MKVLLMHPLTAFVAAPPNIPDLGLGYIMSSLKKYNHQVFIRDWNMNPSVENFKEWLIENKPEAIGIKVFTKDVGAAKKTISIIRETLPEVTIIIGGPHPSAAAPVELMEDFLECDYAIKGEAENSFPSLLSLIINMKIDVGDGKGYITDESAKKISGLVWRNKEGISCNPTFLIHDLDRIDFPCWEILNPNNYSVDLPGSTLDGWNTAPIITTRGCPGKCTFCSAYNVNGRKIRHRSPENVLREMSMLYNQYNVRKFTFQDNCFTSHKEILIKICEGIIKERMNIEWDFVSYERLDNLTNETLSLMYKAGGRMIHIGIESGSEKIRKVMNKSCSLKDISEKVKVIQRNGIKIGAWFMIGFPEETKKEIKETIKYAFSLGADLTTFTICFPLPGSQVYYHIREEYKFDKIDWSNFDIYNSPYPMSELSSKELTRMLKKIRLRIRLNKVVKKLVHFIGVK
jgi:radical SAM superfamily enzyme YgiQ (UPF0313 family)